MAKKDIVDYDDVLERSWDEMPEDVLLPDGVWAFVGRNAAFSAPKQEGQNAKVLFFLTPKAPLEVDEDALAELGEGFDPTEQEVVHTIWIERAKDWGKVKVLLEAAGTFDPERTIKENLKAFRKGELSAIVGTRSFQVNGETRVENTVSGFQPIE